MLFILEGRLIGVLGRFFFRRFEFFDKVRCRRRMFFGRFRGNLFRFRRIFGDRGFGDMR